MFQNKERIGAPESVSSSEKKAIEYNNIQPFIGSSLTATARKALQLQPKIGNRNVTQLMKSGIRQQKKQGEGRSITDWVEQFKSADSFRGQTEHSGSVVQMAGLDDEYDSEDEHEDDGIIKPVSSEVPETTFTAPPSPTTTTTSSVEKPKTPTSSAELSPTTSGNIERTSPFYDYSDEGLHG
ncbi:hypothetical protein ACFVS2_33875 [Brevibacillus sp. NPDC058079]|uniref:hypothetical protein n=1 Tax=Brevibacillus sp. NPDC058079 TaxID=3346330 RepID=UPI0036E276FF